MDIRPLPEYIRMALNKAIRGFIEMEYGIVPPQDKRS
jgi:hypothetical protein